MLCFIAPINGGWDNKISTGRIHGAVNHIIPLISHVAPVIATAAAAASCKTTSDDFRR